MPDIQNITGLYVGNQRLGSTAIKVGRRAAVVNVGDAAIGTARADGDFPGDLFIEVSELTGLYENRFTQTNSSADDTAYSAAWDGSTLAPTQNSVYDKIESLPAGGSSFNGILSGTGALVFSGRSQLNSPSVGVMYLSGTGSLGDLVLRNLNSASITFTGGGTLSSTGNIRITSADEISRYNGSSRQILFSNAFYGNSQAGFYLSSSSTDVLPVVLGFALNTNSTFEINNGTAGVYRDLNLRNITGATGTFAGPVRSNCFQHSAGAFQNMVFGGSDTAANPLGYLSIASGWSTRNNFGYGWANSASASSAADTILIKYGLLPGVVAISGTGSLGDLVLRTISGGGVSQHASRLSFPTNTSGALSIGTPYIAAADTASTHRIPILVSGLTLYLLASNV